LKKCLECGTAHQGADWGCPSCGAQPAMRGGFLSFAPDSDGSEEGFDPSVFETLARIESGSFWFAARNRLIKWALAKHFPDAKTVFEAGCGTGFALSGIQQSFPNIKVSGADLFARGLEFAAGRLSPGTELYQMDAARIPFKDEFDVVCSLDSLEHIKDDEGALRGMFEAVRPGGGLVCSVPQHPWLWSEFDEQSRHERRYAARELKQKVERAGFSVVFSTSFMALLFPAMLASRMVWKLKPGRAATSEFKSGLLNSALGAAAAAEASAIMAGARFPFGGSLLVVAKKTIPCS